MRRWSYSFCFRQQHCPWLTRAYCVHCYMNVEGIKILVKNLGATAPLAPLNPRLMAWTASVKRSPRIVDALMKIWIQFIVWRAISISIASQALVINFRRWLKQWFGTASGYWSWGDSHGRSVSRATALPLTYRPMYMYVSTLLRECGSD